VISSGDAYSPACIAQLKQYDWCKRVSPGEIEDAIRETHALAKSEGFELLLLNLDFLATAAGRIADTVATADGIPFVDIVGRMAYLRSVSDDARTGELGIEPSGPTPSLDRERDTPGPDLLFRLQVADREYEYSVRGEAAFSEPHTVNNRLYDDGSHGDEIADDGVYSAIVSVPEYVNVLMFRFFRDEDPEFIRVPPSQASTGDRALIFSAGLRTPVYEFGKRFMMAERVHPNADGYAMIARQAASAIAELESFPHNRSTADQAKH
jgi:hypothetical protein